MIAFSGLSIKNAMRNLFRGKRQKYFTSTNFKTVSTFDTQVTMNPKLVGIIDQFTQKRDPQLSDLKLCLGSLDSLTQNLNSVQKNMYIDEEQFGF